jgi:hypothetical protein
VSVASTGLFTGVCNPVGVPLNACSEQHVRPDALALVGELTPHPVPACGFGRPCLAKVSGPGAATDITGQLTSGFVDVSFRAPVPGRYHIELEWPGGWYSSREVMVPRVDLLTTSTQRFVDRMDSCNEGPYRSRTGLTFCVAQGIVYVYAADGSFSSQFPGVVLRVRGNEVWSARDFGAGAVVEHRTALADGGLRVDGNGALPVQGVFRGEVFPGALVMPGANQVVITTFDAGVVTSTATTIPLPLYGASIGVLEGNGLVESHGCRLTPGCTVRPDCAPVYECPREADGGQPNVDWSYTTFSSEALFGGTGLSGAQINGRFLQTMEIDYMPRPISFRRPFVYRYETTIWSTWLERDRPALAVWGNVLLTPHVFPDGGLEFSAARTAGTPLTVTDDWVLSTPDPFTLAFSPSP